MEQTHHDGFECVVTVGEVDTEGRQVMRAEQEAASFSSGRVQRCRDLLEVTEPVAEPVLTRTLTAETALGTGPQGCRASWFL